MALTGEQLVDEVQALVGRTENQVLIDDTRVTRWLNEAQRTIAEKAPGLLALTYKNTVSLDTTAQLKWPLADITGAFTYDATTTVGICHIYGVQYLDGAQSMPLRWVHIDEFDKTWPDPTNSDTPTGQPTWWTRREKAYIEIMPIGPTAIHDKDWRFDVQFYPCDLTTNTATTSKLDDADDLLIAYGVWKAWDAMGQLNSAALWKKKFSNPDPMPGEDFGLLEDYIHQNGRLDMWDGNLFSDGL